MNKETAKTLADIGFMASAYQQREATEAIFSSLILNHPENTVPFAGMAHMHIMAGKFQDAIDILENKALKVDAADPMSQALLCTAYKMAGKKKESDAILNKLKEDHPDSALHDTAQGLIKIFEDIKELNAVFSKHI